MQSPLSTYKRETCGVAAFGGLNHSDLAKPGEWYDMENLSDCHAPLLAPRRSRALRITLPEKADTVISKNDVWYFVKNGSGIFCYAPHGDNPFSETATTQPLCIFESEKAYHLLEMGNSIFAVPKDGSENALAIQGDTVEELGDDVARSYKTGTVHPATHRFLEPTAYYKSEEIGYYYSRAYEQKIKRGEEQGLYETYFEKACETQPGGYYDDYAQRLLNISFTYSVQREDGSFYHYDNQNNARFSPSKNDFAATRYFLGTDNKLYHFDFDSKAVTEVTTPFISIMLRPGMKKQRTYPADNSYEEESFVAISPGDYINLTVGETINQRYRRGGFAGKILEKQLLHVQKSFAIDPANAWGQRGWRYCIIANYDAQFIQKLIQRDLIYNSVAYTALSTASAADDIDNDRGTKQLYPRYIHIEKSVPSLAVPIEHNNRIWGAHNANNEIKASAQGNFKNWDDYRGLVSDSYTVSVGSNDVFCASCAIGEYLYFFKEHSYTMIYGTRPSNYCTQTCNDFIGPGAQSACSLQVIGRNAYYMGSDGRIYRFNGQNAVCISKALGERRYTALAAAHSHEKYFLFVSDSTGAQKLLLYNVQTGTWWIEDARHCDTICNINAQACMLSSYALHDGSRQGVATDVLLLDLWDATEAEDAAVDWWCESGLLGLESDSYQYISDLKITFESEPGARVEVLAQYDNAADYLPLASFVSEKKATHTQKIAVRRCAFFRLKIRGRGKSRVMRISYVRTQGSEK